MDRAFCLLALSFQDELPPPQVPTLAIETGKFAPLKVSEEEAVGIDLATITRNADGQLSIDAYFLAKEPDVEPVAGVAYSRILPSYMTKASVLVDCTRRSVRVTQWSFLSDLGYMLREVPSRAEPMSPDPFSPWTTLLHVSCSSAEQAQLPILESFVQFHERMVSMRVDAAVEAMTRQGRGS